MAVPAAGAAALAAAVAVTLPIQSCAARAHRNGSLSLLLAQTAPTILTLRRKLIPELYLLGAVVEEGFLLLLVL